MAKRAAEDPELVDRIAGFPHPRETFRLVGQGEALARAARAVRSGRPPQGWLIGGPPGIGKATLAYRVARYLLRYGATTEGPEDLSVPANDAVAALVRAGSHPGLLALIRGLNPQTKKTMTVLAVDTIRKVEEFFSLTSAAGGWRIAIIDTADEMNASAANALLKSLEEPPRRAMLILVSNTPGRLLPTIRSRCQRLDLKLLSDAEIAAELARHLPRMRDSERASLVKLARGSLGAALALAGEEGMALANDAERLLDSSGSPDSAALLALGDRVARMGGGVGKFGTFLAQGLADRIRERAGRGEGNLRSWVDAWERVNANFERAGALHLEPRQTILSSAHAIHLAANRNPPRSLDARR